MTSESGREGNAISLCFFVSDLHGRGDRYRKLFDRIADERPWAVFLGGDLLPHSLVETGHHDFQLEVMAAGFRDLAAQLGSAAPRVLLIPGNDDPRAREAAFLDADTEGIWNYLHGRRIVLGAFTAYGYACVPPTPFQLKDWERYDVSRHVDPGCVSPEEGIRSVAVPAHRIRHATIQEDLERLAGDDDLSRAVFLFHAPPYQTALDRAALDGKRIDHVPLDVHVGSIAIQRFIQARQPLLTLHGHIHESPRLTGSWRDRIGRTHLFSAAHEGSELALVRLDPEDPERATRELL